LLRIVEIQATLAEARSASALLVNVGLRAMIAEGYSGFSARIVG